jgi:hypothetical protein
LRWSPAASPPDLRKGSAFPWGRRPEDFSPHPSRHGRQGPSAAPPDLRKGSAFPWRQRPEGSRPRRLESRAFQPARRRVMKNPVMAGKPEAFRKSGRQSRSQRLGESLVWTALVSGSRRSIFQWAWATGHLAFHILTVEPQSCAEPRWPGKLPASTDDCRRLTVDSPASTLDYLAACSAFVMASTVSS